MSRPIHTAPPAARQLATRVALACALLLATATDSPAASSEQTCLLGIQSAVTKFTKAQGKDAKGCMQARAKGTSTGTNAGRCLVDDVAGRVAKAATKATALQNAKCPSPPAFGYAAPATVQNAAAEQALGLVDDLLGAQPGSALIVKSADPAGALCQTKALSALQRLAHTERKEFTTCLRKGFKEGTITDATSTGACIDAMVTDASGKIAKSRAKLAKTISGKCPAPASTLSGPCGDAADASACLAGKVTCRNCLLLSEAHGLDTDCDLADDGAANASCIECNGAASLCDRRFDEVVYPTSHNAMSNNADGWTAPNQNRSVPDQLAAGTRSVMLDTWYWDEDGDGTDDAVLCHGGEVFTGVGCDILGIRPAAEGLAELTTFLDQNPDEVLSIIFESYINESDTKTAVAESGLDAHVHSQSSGTPWPTLRELIAAGTRMVVFTDRSESVLPWHHYVWNYAWETNFSALEPDDLLCGPNRGSTDSSLMILNHFLTNPFAFPHLAEEVNPNPFLQQRARNCQDESAQLPNFVTVDFEDIGDLYPTVRALNGLPPTN